MRTLTRARGDNRSPLPDRRPGSELRSSAGFTLVELLVVVIIIGILAAIAVPIYMNQRHKAYVAASVSDLRNFSQAAHTMILEGADPMAKSTFVEALAASGSRAAHAITGASPKRRLVAVCASRDGFVMATAWALPLTEMTPRELPVVDTRQGGSLGVTRVFVDQTGNSGQALAEFCDSVMDGAPHSRWWSSALT